MHHTSTLSHLPLLRRHLHFPAQRDLRIQTPLQLATARGRGARGGGGRGGVESRGGQHLRGRVDKVHGVHGRAVEFEHVEAADAVVGVFVDGVALEAGRFGQCHMSCAVHAAKQNFRTTVCTGT